MVDPAFCFAGYSCAPYRAVVVLIMFVILRAVWLHVASCRCLALYITGAHCCTAWLTSCVATVHVMSSLIKQFMCISWCTITVTDHLMASCISFVVLSWCSIVSTAIFERGILCCGNFGCRSQFWASVGSFSCDRQKLFIRHICSSSCSPSCSMQTLFCTLMNWFCHVLHRNVYWFVLICGWPWKEPVLSQWESKVQSAVQSDSFCLHTRLGHTFLNWKVRSLARSTFPAACTFAVCRCLDGGQQRLH